MRSVASKSLVIVASFSYPARLSIRLVPEAVMFGFVNGLAIVIFLAQLSSFKTQVAIPGGDTKMEWMTGVPLYLMIALVALTMLVIWQVSRLTKAFPAPLAAILVVSAIVIGGGLATTNGR